MPEQIRCPSCGAALRVPETLLGKNVKCPKCQKTFLADMDEPVEPEAIVREPAPSSARRRPKLSEETENEEEELPLEEELEEEEHDRPRRRGRRRRSSRIAESAVIGPAISIMVVSGFSIVGGLVDLGYRIFGPGLNAKMLARSGIQVAQPGLNAGVFLGGAFDVLSMILPIVMVVGAFKMKNLQNYTLALTTCILAILPLHCCCCIGLPFGIWGLVMLSKPEVKDAFS
jgi:predicted Zn finger-like uncharacterized protein